MNRPFRPYIVGRDEPAAPVSGEERLALPEEIHSAELAAVEDADLEQMVFEGEVVDELDEPSPDYGSSLPAPVASRVIRVISIQPSEGTLLVARVTLGTAVTIGQGWTSWLARIWGALTHGVYRRQIRAAEAAGDREALGEWVERKEKAVAQRHARLMDLPILVVGVVKAAAIGCLGLLVFLLLLSVAVWATSVGEFGAVWRFIGSVIGGVLALVAWSWPFLMIVTPIALLIAAWREGRRSGTPLTWTVAPAEETRGRDVIPDEGAILNALRNLGIPELNKAFKAGWRPRFVLPTERDGKGYHTQLELPPAVTVEMINKKKAVLAHNLVRFPVEVWPTEPRSLPGVLDMWVADQGALTGPVAPWPLLNNGGGDYFKGVPVAVDIRGKSIIARLFEANYAIAGMMGSGKSTLIITLLLGALLDPLVEADVFVMAVNADYDPMKRRLRTLLTGTGEEVVEACLGTLRGAYDELNVRGKALKEYGARAVTRELAEKDARLRPRIIVIDECQALFMHEEYGDAALEVAVKLQSAARKYAVTVVYATPEPSTDSLPRRLITITSNRACFAIGDQRSNDAVLGTGSYKAGISAVGLEPKTDEGPGDVGTFMAQGFTGKPSLLRGYYVSQGDAHPVVERAMQIRAKAGIGGGPIEGPRDLLEDVATVLGGETRPLADLPALLSRLAPRWAPYERLTGKELREQLAALGAKVPSTGNRWPVAPELIRDALAAREEDES